MTEARNFLFLKDNECGNCSKTHEIIKKVKKQNPKHRIKIVDVESPAGQQIIKSKNIKQVPYIVDCPQRPLKKGDDPDKTCTIINKHDPNYWSKYLK